MKEYGEEAAAREFSYFKKYITEHKDRSCYPSPDGYFLTTAAPYRGAFVSLESGYSGIDPSDRSERIIFSKSTKELVMHSDPTRLSWHRLDGPASIELYEGKFNYFFWVDDHLLAEPAFLKHPLVVEYRLGKIISEVLSE